MTEQLKIGKERFTATCPACHDRHMTFGLVERKRKNGTVVWDRAVCGGCSAVMRFNHTHASGRICFKATERDCPSL